MPNTDAINLKNSNYNTVTKTKAKQGNIQKARFVSRQPASFLTELNLIYYSKIIAISVFVLFGKDLYAKENKTTDNKWKVSTHTEKLSKDTINYFSIDNGKIYVDFSQRAAWTVRKLKYQDETLINDRHGAWNGTVCHFPKEIQLNSDPGWCGTGHRGEIIESIQIFVDGKAFDYTEKMNLTGQKIRVIKKSRIHLLAHTAEIIFPETGDYIIEKHHYRVIDNLKDKFHFIYAFMHCNRKELAEWIAELDDKTQKDQKGIANKNSLEAPLKHNVSSLKKDIKSLAFYSSKLNKGLVYIYPEIYKGSIARNQILDRPYDVKFYFRPEINPESTKGTEFFYEVKVVPFDADPATWKQTVSNIRKQDSFPKSTVIGKKTSSVKNLKEAFKVDVRTEKEDALYSVNEKIKFRISILENETPIIGVKLNYLLKKDGCPPEKGVIVSDGKPVSIETSLDKPGFILCTVTCNRKDGTLLKGMAGAGVEPLKIKPGADPPEDFDQFWNRKIDLLKKLPIEATLTPVPVLEKIKNNVESFDVKINCPGGKPVSGYFSKPLKAKAKSLPAYISFHGAGVKTAVNPFWRSMNGMLAMNINAHGIENGKPEEYYTKLKTSKLKDYPHFNSDDKDKIYFLGMFLRVYRALQFLKSQKEWDGKTLIVYGNSQGGGQALVAAGLDPQVTYCVARVPALCDHLGENKDRQSGWPGFVRSSKRLEKDPRKIRDTVGYFDAVNFAARIKGEAVFSVGFIDTTCSPASVYAAYNNVKSKKSIINNISSGHREPKEISGIINQKIKKYLIDTKK